MTSQVARPISAKADTAHTTWQAPAVKGPIAGKNGSSPGKPPTVAELQALQKDAWQQAFAEGKKAGMEKGYQEGIKQGQDAIRKQQLRLQDLCTHFAEPLKELDNDIQALIAQLAIQIARHLVRREFHQEPGEIIAVVREALAALPISTHNPRIFLHPEDVELVKSSLSINEQDRQWQIHEDLMITRGDCRVETDSSFIDASIDAKLAAVAATILGGERDVDTGI